MVPRVQVSDYLELVGGGHWEHIVEDLKFNNLIKFIEWLQDTAQHIINMFRPWLVKEWQAEEFVLYKQ